jgi:hypothetical protein
MSTEALIPDAPLPQTPDQPATGEAVIPAEATARVKRETKPKVGQVIDATAGYPLRNGSRLYAFLADLTPGSRGRLKDDNVYGKTAAQRSARLARLFAQGGTVPLQVIRIDEKGIELSDATIQTSRLLARLLGKRMTFAVMVLDKSESDLRVRVMAGRFKGMEGTVQLNSLDAPVADRPARLAGLQPRTVFNVALVNFAFDHKLPGHHKLVFSELRCRDKNVDRSRCAQVGHVIGFFAHVRLESGEHGFLPVRQGSFPPDGERILAGYEDKETGILVRLDNPADSVATSDAGASTIGASKPSSPDNNKRYKNKKKGAPPRHERRTAGDPKPADIVSPAQAGEQREAEPSGAQGLAAEGMEGAQPPEGRQDHARPPKHRPNRDTAGDGDKEPRHRHERRPHGGRHDQSVVDGGTAEGRSRQALVPLAATSEVVEHAAPQVEAVPEWQSSGKGGGDSGRIREKGTQKQKGGEGSGASSAAQTSWRSGDGRVTLASVFEEALAKAAAKAKK